MIMPRGQQQLLLPVSPVFLICSLLGALGLDMVMNVATVNRSVWMPDILALVLVFWSVHQPLRVGISVAFALGLALDVHQSSLLGQHALAYSVLSYLAIALHRRLLWFSVAGQAAQVLPLLLAGHTISLAVRLISGGDWPGWSLLFAPLLEALLWPVVSMILLMPQKRTPNPDANRPL